jgi:hypothetical protein
VLSSNNAIDSDIWRALPARSLVRVIVNVMHASQMKSYIHRYMAEWTNPYGRLGFALHLNFEPGYELDKESN